MLPAAHRLRRSGDFADVVRRGRRNGRGSVVIHLMWPADTDQHEPVKAGFVVSKAVGGAVVRNKVRRRLRHLVAARLDRLPPGATLVVRAHPSAAAAGYPQLGLDLDVALDAVLRAGARS